MARVAYLFPGQGSQQLGMGLAFAAASPLAEHVFATVNEALSFDLRGLIAAGPAEALAQTEYTQPAILAASVAAWRVATEAGLPPPDFVAGHSLGEYSALVAAGALQLEDAARLVRMRGRFMQEAVPVGSGAMAAILMLDHARVAEACTQIQAELPGRVVVPANINAVDQVVISGHTDAVRAAGDRCLKFGARRVVLLPVSGPFHSPLMLPAQTRLAEVFRPSSFVDATVPVVTNVDAVPETDGPWLRIGLLRQVVEPVLWSQVVDRLVAEGCDTFIELGPGTVLAGLVRRQARQARVFSISDPASLDATRRALAA